MRYICAKKKHSERCNPPSAKEHVDNMQHQYTTIKRGTPQ